MVDFLSFMINGVGINERGGKTEKKGILMAYSQTVCVAIQTNDSVFLSSALPLTSVMEF